MQDVVKKRDQYLARYDVDPYAAFANESGPGIVGRLLTCKKGEWAIGQDSTPVPPEARFLLIVPETMRGWMKWRDGRVIASDRAGSHAGSADRCVLRTVDRIACRSDRACLRAARATAYRR